MERTFPAPSGATADARRLFLDWLVWGFAAEPVGAPWGDRGPDDRRQVADGSVGE